MQSRLRSSLFSVGAAALVFIAGCDSPGMSKKATSPTASDGAAKAGTSQTTTTGAAMDTSMFKGGPTVDTNALSISSEIALSCGLEAKEGKSRPSFEFDSAALAAEDRVMLAEIAKCLTDGALRGRSVALVGRTDPRGEPEYNMGLGGSRADTVDRYMIDLGIGRERLSATSRGEIDAIGKDEAGWAQDRRVDIELVKN